MSAVVLGIDPGLGTTGYAVLQAGPPRAKLIEAGVVRPDGTDLATRLKSLYDGIAEVLDQCQPQAIAVEQLYAHYAHPRTAILMGHARGLFFLLGGQRSLPVYSYPSTKIKKTITGSGRASKEQMQYSIMRELSLKQPPEPHDVADAIAVALCHFTHKGAA
jgi:crossover junction endodeoxyribonuclease RuvC